MPSYDDTTEVTVELPTSVLAAVDEAGKARGHDSRSAAVAAACVAWADAVEAQVDGDESGGGPLGGLTDRVADVDVDVGVDVDEG